MVCFHGCTGESLLLCKAAERDQGRRLMTASLAPVSSCLLRAGEQLSSSMKRAILEVSTFCLVRELYVWYSVFITYYTYTYWYLFIYNC